MAEESDLTVVQGLPTIMTKSSLEAYGWRVQVLPGEENPLIQLERIRNFHIRDDDVLLAAYPKCGTHWLWEITHMLLHQTTEHEKRTKAQVMLESPGGLERADKEPSPRILNSHNVIVHLPQEVIAKKTKIIHMIRNPKDALVSLYWHSKTIVGDDLTFSAMLQAVMGDNLNWPSQFDYLQQMSEFEDTHPGHPIKHIYYEDMKRDCVKTIKELAEFLNVPASDEFCRNVASACSFERMKKIEEEHGKQYPEEIDAAMKQMNKEFKIFRKGTIGDWRNHFTVAQNERFEEYITAETTNKQLKFKFIYE